MVLRGCVNMAGRFPKDCYKGCPNYSEYDLSVDDLVCYCSLLKQQCDMCDEDLSFTLCPIEIYPDRFVSTVEARDILLKQGILVLVGDGGDAEGPPGEPGVNLE